MVDEKPLRDEGLGPLPTVEQAAIIECLRPICVEARSASAAEIRDLRADNARLRAALELARPILCEGIDDYWEETHIEQVMQARAAVKAALAEAALKEAAEPAEVS